MRLRIAAAAAGLALLAGCTASPAGTPSDAAGAERPVAFALDADFPDPDVLQSDGTFYAFATNTAGTNVQVATSDDLDDWELQTTDAMPTLPSWATEGRTWAPEVFEPTPGRFVLYFTAWHTTPSAQCIGVAAADSPEGPYTALSEEPLVCPIDDGGAIDASTFVDDDGTAYLLWKNDGNCCGLPTWLQIAPLSADGSTLTAEPTKLVEQDQDWEGILVEAPTLVRHDDAYVLFYSANDYGGDQYSTGYATAAAVLGPYEKPAEPLLTTASTDGRYQGPGGQDVVTMADGTDRLVFHSWDPAYIKRGMNVIALDWDGDTPVPVMPD